MFLKDQPIDKEVALLIEGIAQEVAIISGLCDTIRDRLETAGKSLSASASRLVAMGPIVFPHLDQS